MLRINTLYVGALLLLFLSCTKDKEFLEKKPNVALSTISTLQDVELLLNDDRLFNTFYPSFGELSSDNLYTTQSRFLQAVLDNQNAYLWKNEIFPLGTTARDWTETYKKVYTANVILDALNTMNVNPSQQNSIMS